MAIILRFERKVEGSSPSGGSSNALSGGMYSDGVEETTGTLREVPASVCVARGVDHIEKRLAKGIQAGTLGFDSPFHR